jgi:hypothetical protein
MINIEKILKESGGLHKFEGIAPEGFVLVHEKTLEELKDFDKWVMWVKNEISLKDLDKKNFGNSL